MSDDETPEEREFTRLMARFVAARMIFGPGSTPANEAFRETVRYAEAHGERIWKLDKLRKMREEAEWMFEAVNYLRLLN